MTYEFREIPITPFTQEMFDVNAGKTVTSIVDTIQVVIRSDDPCPGQGLKVKVGPYWVYVGMGLRQ